MSKAFQRIKRGLGEAIEFSKGKPAKAVVHDLDALDIKHIRSQVGNDPGRVRNGIRHKH